VLKVVKGLRALKVLKVSRVHLVRPHLGVEKLPHILQLMVIKSLQIHLVVHLRLHYQQLHRQDL
jgi:hypothetical protein